MRMRALTLGFLFLLCGCTAGKPGENASATADNQATAPDEPFVPSTALAPITVNAPAFECPALPKSIAGPSIEIARVLRRLACEPELFALSTSELTTKLDLPPGVTFHFTAPAAVIVEVEHEKIPPLAELAAALGIDKPVVHLEWEGGPSHGYSRLGSNPDTGELDRYRPGVIVIPIDHFIQESQPPVEVTPLMADMRVWFGQFAVEMPDGVITLGPDPEGVTQLATAMRILAAKPAMLAEKPESVAQQLKLTGERFSIGDADGPSHGVDPGVSFQPTRTVIPADALASALGLVDARAASINRHHDVWRMAVGENTHHIEWNGVMLEVEVEPVDKRDDDTTLVGATVEYITMRP
jgi:hypothetical protein